MKRLLDKDLSRVSKVDWARLAAYIDGEGSISISKVQSKRGYRTMHMRVFVCNTDPRLIVWCRDTFGGSIRGKPREDRARHRPCWQWTIVSVVAEEILQRCLPYFIIKREQAEIAVAFQKTMNRSAHTRHRTGVPAEVTQFRDQCFDEIKRLKHEPMELELTH